MLSEIHAPGRARHCLAYHPLSELLEGLWNAVVSVEHKADHTLVWVEAAGRLSVKGRAGGVALVDSGLAHKF